jgi:Holliday junction resolvase RusA-like endonuclease
MKKYLILNIEPVAKGRPKVAFKDGHVWSYNPPKTQEAEENILALLDHHKLQFKKGAAVKLTAIFYRTKSKWLPKYEDLPFRKPDLDNFTKLLLDAINGVLVPDDAQITCLIVKKRWSPTGRGYIELTLEDDKT